MIDPGRKRQNDERLRQLIDLQRTAHKRWHGKDSRGLEVVRALVAGTVKNWPVPGAFEASSAEALLPPADSERAAAILIEQAIEPLREALADHALTNGPLVVRMNGNDYELSEPAPFDRRAVFAPLTAHVCFKLLDDVASLEIAVHDPSENKPLGIEQAHYARERTKLLEVEHCLWTKAAERGAHSDRIPYASRVLLLLFAWHPSAHEPPGASTVCVRCGDLIYRARSTFSGLPRCPSCMKETAKQRDWPAHAIAPHGRASWLLRCQYPDCELVFEGPRHRKLCPDHTSSRLSPARRLTRSR